MQLTPEKTNELLSLLKSRFEKNMHRHQNITWEKVVKRLENNNNVCWSLSEMERTGGEPDVIDYSEKDEEIIFIDCSPESPKERRSLCYDQEALESRKEFKPTNSAVKMASEMGIELLNEQQYRALQTFGNFDVKTSSWIKTPDEIRKLGGAIFCDRRYNHVFTYHNGAESYYAVRGFRGLIRV
jgi:hypothetical protein